MKEKIKDFDTGKFANKKIGRKMSHNKKYTSEIQQKFPKI